jgi:hypothetical protein
MALGEFAQNMLATTERDRIRAHVTTCAACQHDLADLSTFVNDIAIEPGWHVINAWAVRVLRASGRAVRVALRPLIEMSWSPPPTPMLAAVRGALPDKPGDLLRYIHLGTDVLGDMTLEAQVVARGATCDVIVRVETPSRWPESAATRLTAEAGDWRAEGLSDDEGQITLSGLPLDAVDLLTLSADYADGAG